jgi:hypothetical protein
VPYLVSVCVLVLERLNARACAGLSEGLFVKVWVAQQHGAAANEQQGANGTTGQIGTLPRTNAAFDICCPIRAIEVPALSLSSTNPRLSRQNPHSLELKLSPLPITFHAAPSTPRPAPITLVLHTRRPPNQERVLIGDNSVVPCVQVSVRSRICLCSYFGRRTV